MDHTTIVREATSTAMIGTDPARKIIPKLFNQVQLAVFYIA